MAKVAADSGFWRSAALGLGGLIIAMLGWFLLYQVEKTDQIQDDVEAIQTDVALIKQRLGNGN